MAGLVDIKFPERQLKNIEKQLGGFKSKLPRVMSRSINKVSVSARADSSRQIAGQIKVKVTTAKKGMTLVRATFARWSSTITLTARRIPLIEFAAKELKKRGVTYRVKKTGKRERVPRAFIRVMSSGHRGVFKRKQKTRNSDDLVAHKPIVELRGPSLKQVFKDSPAIVRSVLAKALSGLERELDRQVKLILGKI
jgi:hypothetical protein